MERGLVKIAGRAEIPGRPLLYETTQFFLIILGFEIWTNCRMWKSCVAATCPRHRSRRLKLLTQRPLKLQNPGSARLWRIGFGVMPNGLSLRQHRVSPTAPQRSPRRARRHVCQDEFAPPYRGRIRGMRYPIYFAITLALSSTSARAEIRALIARAPRNIRRVSAAASMLVMQNGRTIFEHYANGGSARGRWPIFSGTKSFWGIAALAAARDGLFKLDDPVSDTITEWKSDPRKSRITIRELLNQTDGIEGASRLQRASIRDRNAMAIRL